MSDGGHSIEGEFEHSDHPEPPNLRPPSTVLKNRMMTILRGGIGAMTHAVRSGDITTQYDLDKVARWKRKAEKRLHPGGDSLEAVADFNTEYCEEFILGDVAVEGFSCSTKWQRQIVADILAELEEIPHDNGMGGRSMT